MKHNLGQLIKDLSVVGKVRGISVVLLWIETGLPGENLPFRFGDHKPYQMLITGIKPGLQW